MSRYAYIVSVFFVFSGSVFAQPPAHAPTEAHCQGLNCRVIQPGPAFANEDGLPPIHFNENRTYEQCYNALPLPKEMKELPKYFAPVGKDNTHFILPITKSPEQHLQPGDVLVYFRDVDPTSTRLYEHLTKGRWHAAVVGKKGEKLYHLDSPLSMSGDTLDTSLYHILRLRPDAENREAKIQQIIRNVESMRKYFEKNGKHYDAERVTEANIPDKISIIRDHFNKGECPPYRFYCSEVPLTVLVGAGLDPMKSESLLVGLERLERNVIPGLLAARLGKEANASADDLAKAKKELVIESVTDLFRDARMLRELGVTEEELAAFSNTGALPRSIELARDQLIALLNTPPFLRKAAFMASNFMGKDKGEIVSPSDLMDNIFDNKGSLSYVGTYVGDCRVKPEEASTVSRPSVPSAPTPLGRSSFNPATQENHLWQYPMHQHAITDLKISPNGEYLATGSEDQSTKIMNLRSRTVKSLSHPGRVDRLMFSPDSQWVGSILDKEASTRISHVAKDASQAFPYELDSFSPTGRWAVLKKKKERPKEGGVILGGESSSSDYEYFLVDNQRVGEPGYEATPLKYGFNIGSHHFSHDDHYLMVSSTFLTGSEGSAVIDLHTGEVVKKFTGTKLPAIDIAKDGKYVFNATMSGGIERYRLDDLQGKPDKIEFAPGEVNLSFPISSDKVLRFVKLTSQEDNVPTLFDFSGKKTPLKRMSDGSQTIPHISDDGKVIALSGDKGTYFYFVDSGRELVLEDELNISKTLPGNKFAIGSRKTKFIHEIINLETGETKPLPSFISSYSPDGKKAIVENDGTNVFNLETGEKEFTVRTNGWGKNELLTNDVIVKAHDADVHIFAKQKPDLEYLRAKLRDYDEHAYFGAQGTAEKMKKQVVLKMAFEKLRESGMTKSDALREMNSYITRTTYRGFDPMPGEDLHIKGIIEETFPR